MFDHKFKNDLRTGYNKLLSELGIYYSVEFGRYNSWEKGEMNHLKISSGLVKYIRNNNGRTATMVSLGLNGNLYDIVEKGPYIESTFKKPIISGTLGVGIRFDDRSVRIFADPLLGAVGICYGLRF